MKERNDMATLIQLYSLNTDVSDFADLNDAWGFITENYGHDAICNNIISTDRAPDLVVCDLAASSIHYQLKEMFKAEPTANYAVVLDATDASNSIPIFSLQIN